MCFSISNELNVFVECFPVDATNFIFIPVLGVFQLDGQVGVKLHRRLLLQLVLQVIQAFSPISPDGNRKYKS